MELLIFGSTGGTGRELVKQTLAKGHTVTAFVRTPDELAVRHDRLSVVKGDTTDDDSVERAVVGQAAVRRRCKVPMQKLRRHTSRAIKNTLRQSRPRSPRPR